MSLHTRLYRTLTDRQLRLAMVIGLASAPITVALSWGTVLDERTVAGGTVSGTAFLVVGLVVGYLYTIDRRRDGVPGSPQDSPPQPDSLSCISPTRSRR